MEKREYIKIGNAADLTDPKERRIYRALEILPGVLAWGTLAGVVFLSWVMPIFVAFFIIAFDIYWLLKTLFLGLHLRTGFANMKKVMRVDWLARLRAMEKMDLDWREVYHLVILPMYKESYEVVGGTLESLLAANYPKDKLIIVLATEERAGKPAQKQLPKPSKNTAINSSSFL